MNIKSELAYSHYWPVFLKSLGFLFVTTSIAAFLLYFGVSLISKWGLDFSPVLITDGYHVGHLQEIAEHPFSFLLTISFITSLLGAFWIVIIAPRYTRFHILQLLALPWIALILTSPVWGIIWSIYHWPPQYFSDSALMLHYYKYDAMFGLRLGWLSAIISFPINILGFATVGGLLFISKKLFSEKTPQIQS